jgi:hypothetical protein
MRKLAFIVTVALLLGSFPLAAANHFTVGTYDSVGTAPDEDNSEGDRTVRGTTVGPQAPADTDQEYAIGTTPEDECHDPSSEVSQEEVQATLGAHGFCGMLIYHDGNSALQHVSEPDQHYPGPIGTFDVVRAQTYGTGASTCHPFCQEVQGQDNPTGDVAFNETHRAGAQLGLTDPPDQAYSAEDERSQGVGVTAHVVSPTAVAQEFNVWEMNGWWWPSAVSTFVAFLEDNDQDPIDDDELQEMVDRMAGKAEGETATELNPNSEATICGYTPDFQFTTVDPDAPGVNCEFGFSHAGNGGSDTTFDGYDDECETPTYVCGGVNGPAWYSEGCVCLGLTDPKIPGSSPLPGPDSTLAGPEGQTDYIRWHFVVAPHNSKCGGAQEPGFSFGPDGNYDYPYLAHDVDVWTTAASTSAHSAGSAVPEVLDYSDAVAESYTQRVADQIEDPSNYVPDLPLPAETDLVVRNQTLEPNLAQDYPTHPIGDIDDTSRTFEGGDLDTGDLYRDLTGACELLFAQEVDSTTDPWVDLLDSRAIGVQDVDVTGTYATDERVIRHIDPYGSADAEQDGTNRPGPSVYTTNGKVGMFTDKDDDGEYDQLEAGVKYNAQNTLSGGAYPMVWDMHANTTEDGPVPSEDDGCEVSETTLSEAAGNLGYGVNTGLVQAVYLNEQTAFRDPASQTVVPYATGNNIYLMMSSAARDLYEPGGENVAPIAQEIEDLVTNVKSYVKFDLDREEPDVVIPSEDLETDAAFSGQCSGPSGNFDSGLQFAHDCNALACEGDTIVTMYTFEITQGPLEGSEVLPTFAPGEEDPYDFRDRQHTWYDVDPFDNNPERNDQRQDPPPNPNAGPTGEGIAGPLLE